MRADKPRDLGQRTFLFACDIAGFCQRFSTEPGINRHIGPQLLRAGTSMGANLEEAKAAYSRREFASKTSLVLKEAREARHWLRLLSAQKLAPLDQIEPLLIESEELVAIFIATVRTAKGSRDLKK
jgi:four helix bundle protein